MPVGAYVDADVVPTCGLASAERLIGLVDDPASFFEPGHAEASLVWFRQGFLTYRFPNRLPPRTVPESLRFRAELCSEAPMHHEDWPSDVTVYVAGVRLGTWTSPADFGGRRGLLTPTWWDDRNSQFGLLKEWRVTADGTWVDGVRVSDVTLADLEVVGRPTIDVRIGVEADATHVGGLNLFGPFVRELPRGSDALDRVPAGLTDRPRLSPDRPASAADRSRPSRRDLRGRGSRTRRGAGGAASRGRCPCCRRSR